MTRVQATAREAVVPSREAVVPSVIMTISIQYPETLKRIGNHFNLEADRLGF